MYRQEDEQAEAEAAAAARTEDLCDLNAYNRRLRATQSPNYSNLITVDCFRTAFMLVN